MNGKLSAFLSVDCSWLTAQVRYHFGKGIQKRMLEIEKKTLLKSSREDIVHPREHEYQAHYRAYLFGRFRLFHQHSAIEEQQHRRNKAGMLLKWFLLNPGKIGSADEFIDLFWPDVPARNALDNFHVTMHYLRRLLQPDLVARAESRFIHRRTNNFYWFEMDETWWSDSNEVQRLFDTARQFDQQSDHHKASFYYRKIITTCSSGLLPEDITDRWLEPYRQRYKHIYIQALQRMIQLCLQRGELEDVVEYAYQILSIDPYYEPATKTIVEVYLREGNISLASRKFNDFWSFFCQSLGVGPDVSQTDLLEHLSMLRTDHER